MDVNKKGKKKKSESSVICYSVTDPTLHPSGFTVYRVTQQTISLDALEKSTDEVFVWKRFNDFKKLHKEMFRLHSRLHRNEQFPEFSRPQLFNRFDPSVIEERMRSGQDLLNFIGQRKYLVTSQPFRQFFETAQPVQQSAPNLKSPLLPHIKVTDQEVMGQEVTAGGRDGGWTSETDSGPSGMSSPARGASGSRTVSPHTLPICRSATPDSLDDNVSRGSDDQQTFTNSSWLNHPVNDENSGDGLDEDDDDPTPPDLNSPPASITHSHHTPLDISSFDPLTVPDDGSASDGLTQPSNEWLLSVIVAETEAVEPVVVEMERKHSVSSAYATDLADILRARTEDCIMERSGSFGSSSSGRKASTVESGKGDLTASPFRRGESQERVGSESGRPDEYNPSSLLKTQTSLVAWDAEVDRSGYIVDAGELIGKALQCELAGEFSAAFAQYKCAIAILLKGVQTDEDPIRRDAVRKKTARYLMKAEELYHNHVVVKDDDSAMRRGMWQNNSNSTGCDSSIALLQGATKELSRYKVLGVLNGVLLVLDTAADGGATYVIKVLHKTCAGLRTESRTIVPTHIPYVVGLLRFFETECAIFLLLQYASGGTLWNYVGAHLRAAAHAAQPAESSITDREESRRPGGRRKSGEISEMKETESIAGRRVPSGDTDLKTGQVKLKTDCNAGADNCGLASKPLLYSASNVDDASVGISSVARMLNINVRQEGVQFKVDDLRMNKETPPINSRAVGSALETDATDVDVFPAHSRTKDQSSSDLDNGVAVQELATDQASMETQPTVPCTRFGEDLTRVRATGTSLHGLFSIASVDSDNTQRLDSGSQPDTPSANSAGLKNVNFSSAFISSDITEEPQGKECGEADGGGNQELECGSLLSWDGPSIYDRQCDADAISSTDQSDVCTLSLHDVSDDENVASRMRIRLHSPVQLTVKQSKSAGDLRSGSANEVRRNRTLSKTFAELDLASTVVEVKPARPDISDGPQTSCLPESCVRQWAAEMVVAVGRLHVLGLVCLDLRPDNLLLGDRGHILLTYFSEWSTVDRRIDPDAIHNLYCAPEVKSVFEVTAACDWWSVGALLFELLTGQNLKSCHPAGVTQHTLVDIPNYLSQEAQSLLTELLRYNPAERLGGGAGGTDDVRAHPFFATIEWNNLIG